MTKARPDFVEAVILVSIGHASRRLEVGLHFLFFRFKLFKCIFFSTITVFFSTAVTSPLFSLRRWSISACSLCRVSPCCCCMNSRLLCNEASRCSCPSARHGSVRFCSVKLRGLARLGSTAGSGGERGLLRLLSRFQCGRWRTGGGLVPLCPASIGNVT